MQTQCNSKTLQFKGFGSRKLVAAFDGGNMTSDAGALLLREADRRIGLSDQVAACFEDKRAKNKIVHQLKTLVSQRIHGLALGYEDLNDHDNLRHDSVLSLLSDKLESKRKNCAALAGKSTLNRLECGAAKHKKNQRYHKISLNKTKMQDLFVNIFLNSYEIPLSKITLDLDATDDRLHGNQEGKFYHGYYGHYCYLPLYIFSGRHLLAAKLRPANIDGAACSVEELMRIIAQIRAEWPSVEIEIRADSGFCRDDILSWCELNNVGYVIGLSQNSRLREQTGAAMAEARRRSEISGKAERVFTEFAYQTLDSWSEKRRVIAKSEFLPSTDAAARKTNHRFIVTSRTRVGFEAGEIYEEAYCQRGDMENRIKECQLDLFSDRTSTATMAANQLRVWFSALAYELVNLVRRIGLKNTKMQKAMPVTIRLKLFKIAAVVSVSVRRIKVSMDANFSNKKLFKIVYERLRMDLA